MGWGPRHQNGRRITGIEVASSKGTANQQFPGSELVSAMHLEHFFSKLLSLALQLHYGDNMCLTGFVFFPFCSSI